MQRLTFGEIIYRVATLAQHLPTDNYTTQTIPRFVQDAYREIWNLDLWPETVGDDFVFNLPSNSNQFVLAKNYGAILRAYNADTGQPLKLRDRSSYADTAYSVGTQFTQDFEFDSITELAPWPVLLQPTTAGKVTVTSTDATDSTTVLFLAGRDANGNLMAEALTLASGTKQSSNSYTTIEKYSKTLRPTTGVITLTDIAAKTLGALDQWDTTGDYKRYQIDGTSPVSANLQLTCKKAFVPMLNNFDYPFADMDELLIQKSLALVWMEKRQMEMAAGSTAAAQQSLSIMRDRELNQEDVTLMVPSARA